MVPDDEPPVAAVVRARGGMPASSFWERAEEKDDRARVTASRPHMDSESTEKDGARGRKARYRRQRWGCAQGGSAGAAELAAMGRADIEATMPVPSCGCGVRQSAASMDRRR